MCISSCAIEGFGPASEDDIKLCCVDHEEVEYSIDHHHTPKRRNQVVPVGPEQLENQNERLCPLSSIYMQYVCSFHSNMLQ